MMPWVGLEYPEAKVKILHVGESHYLKKSSKAQCNADIWYVGQNLSDKDKSWISTRGIVNNYTNRKKNRKIFSCPGKVFLESGLFAAVNEVDERSVYRHLAFLNFFQRPAREDSTYFKDHYKPIDGEISNKVFREVVEIIQPNAVVFTSCFAYRKAKSGGSIKFLKKRKIKKCRSAHPVARGKGGWHTKRKKTVDFVNSLG